MTAPRARVMRVAAEISRDAGPPTLPDGIGRVLAVAALVWALGCGAGPPGDAPAAGIERLDDANILLVTLDTTRADHLGCYGHEAAHTPTLDRLAGAGVLFERCTTPTAFTLPSHSSIHTGLYPPFHGVRLNGGAALAEVHTTLAEALSGAGYSTGAFVGAFVLDSRWGLGQGFDHYDDDFELEPDQSLDLAGVQRPADQVVDAGLEWLAKQEPGPFFAWVHLYDPHAPYEPPEEYREQLPDDSPGSLYDGEIAFADHEVGRLLRWLDARGVADRTIVAVVGDHGEGLGSHGEAEHGYFLYDYAVQVPLLLRLPGTGLAGVRVSSQVRTVDLAPTLAELVGVDLPPQVQGESLVPLMAAPEQAQDRFAYSESMATNLQYGWSALYSLRTSDYKLVDAPRAELYDLRQDPGEKVNVHAENAAVAAELQRTLDQIRARIAEGAPETEHADLDEQTLAMLASLGYVGGGSAEAEAIDGELADPKDTLHLWEAVGYAAQMISQERWDQAIDSLERALAEDPHIPQAQLLLASAYSKSGRTAEAKVILDRYLERDPDSLRALIAMAGILSAEGSYDEVLAICRRALAVDERNAQAWELMAGVHMAKEDHQGALPLLRKVVEIQPKLTRSRNNLAACLIALGELQEADSLLADILEEFPKFPLANFHRGLLREAQGRLADARAAYETEVANHPEAVAPRANLADLLLRMGEPEAAETYMRQLLEDAPDLARPHLFLARALLKSGGEPAEIERLARAGIERAEAAELKALGYFILADVYSRQGRRADLEEAVRRGRHWQARIDDG